MQTKNLRRLSAVVLALAMTATSAFATWHTYQGNDDHNGVISGAPSSSSASKAVVALTKNGSGWDGVDNVPVMQTVNGTTYAYVLYDGYRVSGTSGGARLAKINCSAATPSEVWNIQVDTESGFQLSTPLLVQGSNPNAETDDAIYLALNSGKVIKVADLSSAPTAITTVADNVDGQINTPVMKYGDYLYFGTWIGNGSIEGSTAPGKYYQVNLNNYADIKSTTSFERGFYWAGAVKSGNYIYFAGDGAKLYWREAGASFDTVGGNLDLPDVNGNAAGDVRSTVCLNDSKLYFTSKGSNNGNLYCFTIGSNGTPAFSWGAQLGGNCTSTPVIAASGKIYVGYYSGFSAGGVQRVAAPTSGTVGTATTLTVGGAAFNQPVQCSPLAQTVGSYDYIYFNTNSGTGAGYCIRIAKSGTTANATLMWQTAANTYALGGMAYDNGVIVFGNDYNNFYVVK